MQGLAPRCYWQPPEHLLVFDSRVYGVRYYAAYNVLYDTCKRICADVIQTAVVLRLSEQTYARHARNGIQVLFYPQALLHIELADKRVIVVVQYRSAVFVLAWIVG